jgi:SAM-dependent methyltransferase
MQDVVAREEAVKQWSANPCGGVGGDETTLDYFLEVERSRYEQQPWQRDHFRFEQYANRRVLEIGVGLGTDLVQFTKAGAVCHGIDITDRHLELAARNFALRGLPVVLKKCDAARIEYPDGYFDLVYSFGVIHHIPDAGAVLREIRRVLKPGGQCLITLYHTYSLFHLYMVLVRGILLGGLFRLGYEGLMATIEGGADGVSLKPYVKVYSRREARALLAGFSPVRVSVHQIELGRWSTSRAGRLFAPILRLLGPLFGWYVVSHGVKPA